jgi:hypothetical protein
MPHTRLIYRKVQSADKSLGTLIRNATPQRGKLMKKRTWMPALFFIAAPIYAFADTTPYKTAEGVEFELPSHWETLNLAESLIYGAATGYVIERQTRESARTFLRETKNLVVATSPRELWGDSEIFFQVNLIPFPNNYSLSQDQFRRYSDEERETFLKSARASSDIQVRDTNAATAGLGHMQRKSISFQSTDNLYCAKTVYIIDFTDQPLSQSEMFLCPIGEMAIVIESGVSSTATSREVQWAQRAINSVRISD